MKVKRKKALHRGNTGLWGKNANTPGQQSNYYLKWNFLFGGFWSKNPLSELQNYMMDYSGCEYE